MRKLTDYTPTRFMAKAYYDKASADYAVGFIEYLLAKLWRRNREADVSCALP